ncbi:MAG TPA: FkbM family methyltransferase [Pseudomonadales bacterium]
MENTAVVTTSLGHQVTVFRNDHVGDKIARNGLYEKENLLLLLKLLQQLPQPTVLDIGANIGNHTLAFATRAHAVHAFEPIPYLYDVLSNNVTRNGLTHVRTHNLALSDHAGTATINMVNAGNYGASSFDRRTEGTTPVDVTLTTGDAFVMANSIPRVDFVKIDVEAHEVFVLRGLMQTLQRDLPFITMEWNDPLTIERLRGSPELDFLQRHYAIHVLGSNYDRGWWSGKPFAFLRRKLTRLLRARTAVLYAFDPNQLYKNLLLVPKGREGLVHALAG